MIIFEGPDLAGKTTLAKLVAKSFDAKYYHFGVPNPGWDHIKDFRETIAYNPYNVVYDRGVLSAVAYNFKCLKDPKRKYTSLYEMRRGIDSMFKHKALLVYVSALDEVLRKRHANRSDDFIDSTELILAADNYRLIWEWFLKLKESPTFLVLHSNHSTKPENYIAEHMHTFKRFLTV